VSQMKLAPTIASERTGAQVFRAAHAAAEVGERLAQVQLKVSGMRPGSFVPEGHLIIARRFNAGKARKRTLVPKGRLRIPLALNRPFGTGLLFWFGHPALKRRAILGSPFGAKRRRELTDSFNRTRPAQAAIGLDLLARQTQGIGTFSGTARKKRPRSRSVWGTAGCKTVQRFRPAIRSVLASRQRPVSQKITKETRMQDFRFSSMPFVPCVAFGDNSSGPLFLFVRLNFGQRGHAPEKKVAP